MLTQHKGQPCWHVFVHVDQKLMLFAKLDFRTIFYSCKKKFCHPEHAVNMRGNSFRDMAYRFFGIKNKP